MARADAVDPMHRFAIVWWAMGCLMAGAFGGCAPTQEWFAFEDGVKFDRKTNLLLSNHDTSINPVSKTGPSRGVLIGDAGLDHYLAYAAVHNPGLAAAFYRWQAAMQRVPQVRHLPDPTLNYRYFIENVETRVGPQRQVFGLSQRFPWFGKLELREGIAVEAALSARAKYQAKKNKLFFDVKKAYYEYYYLSRAIAVVRENQELVRYLEEIARARFRAATAGHPDVIRAQVELGKLDDRLRTLRDLRGPRAARLNALLNRPIRAELPWPDKIPEESIALNDDQLLGWLGKHNPEMIVLAHQTSQHRREIRLARRGDQPDLTIAVDYVDTGGAVMSGVGDSGNDPVSVGISINLPLWHQKYDAAVRESLANFGAVTKQRVDRENILKANLRTAIYQFRDAERKIDLYRDTLVPKAKQSIKATEAAFRAGTASFIDLIDAERVLLAFQLAFERALTDRGHHLAEVEMLVGRPLIGDDPAALPPKKPHQPGASPGQEDPNHET